MGRGRKGGPATSAELLNPRQVVVAPDGSFYVAEALRIVRVDPAGTLAGARMFVERGLADEGPSIALGPDGAAYYTDADVSGSCGEGAHYSEVRVRRLSPSGTEDPVVAVWANDGRVGSCSPSVKLGIDGAGSFYLSARQLRGEAPAGQHRRGRVESRRRRQFRLRAGRRPRRRRLHWRVLRRPRDRRGWRVRPRLRAPASTARPAMAGRPSTRTSAQ